MPECQLVHQSERRTTKDRNLAAGLQRTTSAQFVKLLKPGRVGSDSSGNEGMSKASTELLEQGTQTPSPAPDLIPAQTENQPRTHIGIGTANGGTSLAICGFDPTSNGNGLLETKTGNIGYDALESDLVPASRIEDIYLLYGDHLNGRRGGVHAAPGIRARWAMPKKKSRVTKRYVSKPAALSSASKSFSKVMSRLGRR